MNAAKVDIKITQGSDFKKVFQLKALDGSTFDLTSYAVAMKVKETYDSSTALLDSATNITLTLSVPNGTLTVEITNTITAALDFISAIYDIEFTDPTSKVQKYFYGDVRFQKEVTA